MTTESKIEDDDFIFTDSPTSHEDDTTLITEEIAKQIDLQLKDYHVISLIFLLFDQSLNHKAYQYCKNIDSGNSPFKNKGFISCVIANDARSNNSMKGKNRSTQIICALYILRRFKICRELLNLDKKALEKRFLNQEAIFVSLFKLTLYRICEKLETSDSANLVNRIVSDHKSLQIALMPKYCLETNLLEMMRRNVLKEHDHNEKFSRILEEINPIVAKLFDKTKPIKIPKSYKNDGIEYFRTDGNGGLVLIFNQINFTGGYDRRDGSEADVIKIREIFSQLNCEIKVFNDSPASLFENLLRKYQKDDILKEKEFLFIFVLTHGMQDKHGKEVLICTDGKGFPTDDIRRLFGDSRDCPNLTGKPCFIIIQACRGKKDISSINVEICEKEMIKSCGETTSDEADDRKIYNNKVVSSVGHTFIFQSTVKDYLAYKHSENGSFFIQSFCKILTEYAGKEDIVEHCNRVIADLRNRVGYNIPEFTHSLGQKFIFHRNKRDITHL